MNNGRMKTAPYGRQLLSLLCALCVVGMELAALTQSWRQNGASMFRFYTEDSNLFALAASAVYAVFAFRALRGGRPVPRAAVLLKYAAACCLALTFAVVVCVLAPMMGAQGYAVMLFGEPMLFTHFLCPLVAVGSCVAVDREELPPRAEWAAAVPTLLYAAVTVVLNLARKLDGPYPFLRVWAQPWWASVLWCAAILGAAVLLARLLAACRRRRLRKGA